MQILFAPRRKYKISAQTKSNVIKLLMQFNLGTKIERSGKCFHILPLSSHWIFCCGVLYIERHSIRYCGTFCCRERTMKFCGIKISMDWPFASLDQLRCPRLPLTLFRCSFQFRRSSLAKLPPQLLSHLKFLLLKCSIYQFSLCSSTRSRNWDSNPGNCLHADCIWPAPRLDVKGGEDPTKVRIHAPLLPEKGESDFWCSGIYRLWFSGSLPQRRLLLEEEEGRENYPGGSHETESSGNGGKHRNRNLIISQSELQSSTHFHSVL